jgi:hypothetical protein
MDYVTRLVVLPLFIMVLAMSAALAVGVFLTRLWDFLWDALDRRDTRDAIRGVSNHPEAQRGTSETVPAPDPQPVELIRTKRCPEGWSAKQILGYPDVKERWVAPTYPGGIDAWDDLHGVKKVA